MEREDLDQRRLRRPAAGGASAPLRGSAALRLLLDTHYLLWWLDDDARLPEGVRQLIASPENEVLISAASVWEVAIKRTIGRLRAPDGLAEMLEPEGFTPLPITPKHAERAGELPLHHRDPFDRMLVAQAQLDGLMLASADERIRRYGVPVLEVEG